MAWHQHLARGFRKGDELLHLLAAHRRRLLHEDVLASLERLLRKVEMRWHRGRDHHGVDGVVGDQVVEGCGDSRRGIPLGVLGLTLGVRVAYPGELRELRDDPHDVLAPATDSGVGDTDHSFQTLGLVTPWRPTAFRRSTTSAASSTSWT